VAEIQVEVQVQKLDLNLDLVQVDPLSCFLAHLGLFKTTKMTTIRERTFTYAKANLYNLTIGTKSLLSVTREMTDRGLRMKSPLAKEQVEELYNEWSSIIGTVVSIGWYRYETLEILVLTRDYMISRLLEVNLHPLRDREKVIEYFTMFKVPHFHRKAIREGILAVEGDSTYDTSGQQGTNVSDILKIAEQSRMIKFLEAKLEKMKCANSKLRFALAQKGDQLSSDSDDD
jgi:hypothetical protein